MDRRSRREARTTLGDSNGRTGVRRYKHVIVTRLSPWEMWKLQTVVPTAVLPSLVQ